VEILARPSKNAYELHHGVTIHHGGSVRPIRWPIATSPTAACRQGRSNLIDEGRRPSGACEVTSKPQVVEEAEAELRRVELALLAGGGPHR